MTTFDVLLLVVFCLSQLQLSACALTDADERLLDAVVREAQERGDIPGLALSIVDRSTMSVLVAKGYGVADVSSGRPMTADTLLPIASTSKAFTSTLLALLIEKHAATADAIKSVHSVRRRAVISFFVIRLSQSQVFRKIHAYIFSVVFKFLGSLDLYRPLSWR